MHSPRDNSSRGNNGCALFRQSFLLLEEYRSPFQLSPDVIVDAGANVGMASLYFASPYPGARILAIEPETSNFQMLQRDCADYLMQFSCKRLFRPAHGRRLFRRRCRSMGLFCYCAERKGGHCRSDRNYDRRNFGQTSIDNVYLLKLDIEGSKRELFSADTEARLGPDQCIVVELHDRLRPGCAELLFRAYYREFSKKSGEKIF